MGLPPANFPPCSAINLPVIKNFDNIAFFGRWDDFFALIGTACEGDMFNYLKRQLETDVKLMEQEKQVSLLAKWLKTQKASSMESKAIWLKTIKAFGMTKKEYQQTTAKLRRWIDVTEVKMCNKDWDKIEYSEVPSLAMLKYKNAFFKRDGDRFNRFIDSLEKGETKINSTALFPFDIFRDIGIKTSWSHCMASNWSKIAEEQWKALPDYLNGREFNAIVMADTSGSMEGNPLNVALSLAVYFAERNQGAYHNKFMTFSSKTSFVELKGDTLQEKVANIPSIVENTNLQAAFELILRTAINNNLTVRDMPKSLVVISDMEFDSATGYYSNDSWTFYESMRKMYDDKGYEIPNIIFWNVNSRHDVFQVTSDYKGVQLASGQSPSVFKSILKNIGCTPYEAMVNTLNNPVYDCITI